MKLRFHFFAPLLVMAGPLAQFSMLHAQSSEKVLTLTGNGNYLELPAELFLGLNEGTLECRVKWHTFAGNEHVFEFDAAKRIKVGNRVGQPDLEFMAAAPPADAPPNPQPPSVVPGQLASNVSPIEFEKNEAAATSPKTSDSIVQAGALTLDRWHHIAVVFDASGTQLYLDGTLVGSAPYTKGLAPGGARRHFMGSCSLYPNNSFHGQLAEVRLWRVARTADQIRQNKDRALTGSDPGLAGLWTFDDPANPGRDSSPNGHQGTLMGNARVVQVADRVLPSPRAENLVLTLDGECNLETDAVVVDTTKDWTVECWAFVPASARGAYRHLMAQDSQLYLGTVPDGTIRMGDFWNQTGVAYPYGGPYGGWHHLAVVKRSQGTELYIDGRVAAKRDLGLCVRTIS